MFIQREGVSPLAIAIVILGSDSLFLCFSLNLLSLKGREGGKILGSGSLLLFRKFINSVVPYITSRVLTSAWWVLGERSVGARRALGRNCSVGRSASARWDARRALGGNCLVGARRALSRIARRACSVALGGISGVASPR